MLNDRDDGVSLTNAAHPLLPWYRRPWSWLRCQWTYLFGFSRDAVESFALARCDRHGGLVRAELMVDEEGLRVCQRCIAGEFTTGPLNARLKVPEHIDTSKWYGTKGQ